MLFGWFFSPREPIAFSSKNYHNKNSLLKSIKLSSEFCNNYSVFQIPQSKEHGPCSEDSSTEKMENLGNKVIFEQETE